MEDTPEKQGFAYGYAWVQDAASGGPCSGRPECLRDIWTAQPLREYAPSEGPSVDDPGLREFLGGFLKGVLEAFDHVQSDPAPKP